MNSDELIYIFHELKTPMSAIHSFAEYLKNSNDEESKSIGNIISDNIKYQKHLIDNFNYHILIENRQLEISKIETDIINNSILPIIFDLKMTADKKNMRIVKMPDSHIDKLLISTDAALISVIFSNLFDNAVKYGKQDSDIQYGFYLQNNCFRCDIINTCEPISETDMKRMFGKYERLDAVKNNIRGAGLGLYIADALAQKLSARIICANIADNIIKFSVII